MTDSKTPDWVKEEASDLYDIVSDAPSTAKAKAEITLALVEAERRGSANLISIIADIREKSGVGAKPMLGELADAISQALLSAYERGRKEGIEEAAKVDKSFGDTWSNSRDVEVAVQEAAVDEKVEEIATAIRQLLEVKG